MPQGKGEPYVPQPVFRTIRVPKPTESNNVSKSTLDIHHIEETC